MNKKDLQFMLAFAKSRGIMKSSFEEVYNKVCVYLDECAQYYDCDPMWEIDNFLAAAKRAEPYTQILGEVMYEMHTGATLEEACREWDV